MNNLQKVKHLYWRAGFGLSPLEWENKKEWTVSKAVTTLFAEANNISLQTPNFFPGGEEKFNKMGKEAKKEFKKKQRQLVFVQNLNWMERMASRNESPLLERMTLFWHGHFACRSRNSKATFQQLQTIRTHALGNFRDLVIAIAKDPAMLKYLNNNINRKNSPNENFARELMELFTIGRGNYTEVDVKEAARAFTGWSSDLKVNFVFKQKNHDTGLKTFMGTTGNFDGTDIINIILERKETALFLASKVYRYFVNHKIDTNRVEEMAAVFYDADYDIKTLMLHVFQSDWFYEPQNVGNKIKSPIDLMAGIMRSFELRFDDKLSLLFIPKALGQELFNPPNVAGWPGGRQWIDNSTLLFRLNLIAYLFQADVDFKIKDELDSQQRGKGLRKLNVTIDLQTLVDNYKNLNETQIVEELSKLFLPQNITPKIDFIINHSPAETKMDFIKMATMQIMSLPEYQLC